MIICNGFPKSGTHILTEMMESFGKKRIGGLIGKYSADEPLHRRGISDVTKSPVEQVLSRSDDYYVHGHVAYGTELDFNNKHIVIFRNPKDSAVSWMRERVKYNPELKPGKKLLIKLIKRGIHKMPLPNVYASYLPWLKEKNVCIVRFESAFDLETITKIIQYLDLDPALAEEVINSKHKGPTATSSWSKWQEFWDEEVEDIWNQYDGNVLCYKLGYLESISSDFSLNLTRAKSKKLSSSMTSKYSSIK